MARDFMTDTELRELDAWIAERVMGWKTVKFINQLDNVGHGKPVAQFYHHPMEGICISVPGQMNRIKSFLPTTDPAAAMQVLEKCCAKLEKDGMSVGICKSADGWDVSDVFFGVGYLSDTQGDVAETLPLAICQFAKKLFSK